MLTLALDAAASIGTIAVLRDATVVAERDVRMRSADEERFMPAVLAALADARVAPAGLDRIVCGAGPGSFTSLRVAGAVAKGLAMGADLPLLAVPSLALIVAASDATMASGSRWLATLDAMRGERYLALVVIGEKNGGALASIEPLGLAPASDVAARAVALGARAIGPDEDTNAWPHARGVARCLGLVEATGPVDIAAWEPVYGRLAEAQARLLRSERENQ